MIYIYYHVYMSVMQRVSVGLMSSCSCNFGALNLYKFVFVRCIKPRVEFQTNLPAGPLTIRVRMVYCKFIGGLLPVINNFIVFWTLNGTHLKTCRFVCEYEETKKSLSSGGDTIYT